MNKNEIKIGFIGQGWIGKNFADEFEERGFETVRYGLEKPYNDNKDLLKICKIVFVAVPTPTTAKEGFSYDAVIDALTNLSEGTIAVIKSTILPGTTRKLQKMFPHLYVLHSPEFLAEKTVKHDVRNPNRNLIGIPVDDYIFQEKAKQVMRVLPRAPYEKIMLSDDAEYVKYAGNCFLYSKVVFMNMFYDLVSKSGANYEVVRDAFIADPRIGASHTNPIDASGHDTDDSTCKRGAGGHCFIKDFEAFRKLYAEKVGKDFGYETVSSMTKYNNSLLIKSKKDLDLLEGVFGSEVLKKDTSA